MSFFARLFSRTPVSTDAENRKFDYRPNPSFFLHNNDLMSAWDDYLDCPEPSTMISKFVKFSKSYNAFFNLIPSEIVILDDKEFLDCYLIGIKSLVCCIRKVLVIPSDPLFKNGSFPRDVKPFDELEIMLGEEFRPMCEDPYGLMYKAEPYIELLESCLESLRFVNLLFYSMEFPSLWVTYRGAEAVGEGFNSSFHVNQAQKDLVQVLEKFYMEIAELMKPLLVQMSKFIAYQPEDSVVFNGVLHSACLSMCIGVAVEYCKFIQIAAPVFNWAVDWPSSEMHPAMEILSNCSGIHVLIRLFDAFRTIYWTRYDKETWRLRLTFVETIGRLLIRHHGLTTISFNSSSMLTLLDHFMNFKDDIHCLHQIEAFKIEWKECGSSKKDFTFCDEITSYFSSILAIVRFLCLHDDCRNHFINLDGFPKLSQFFADFSDTFIVLLEGSHFFRYNMDYNFDLDGDIFVVYTGMKPVLTSLLKRASSVQVINTAIVINKSEASLSTFNLKSIQDEVNDVEYLSRDVFSKPENVTLPRFSQFNTKQKEYESEYLEWLYMRIREFIWFISENTEWDSELKHDLLVRTFKMIIEFVHQFDGAPSLEVQYVALNIIGDCLPKAHCAQALAECEFEKFLLSSTMAGSFRTEFGSQYSPILYQQCIELIIFSLQWFNNFNLVNKLLGMVDGMSPQLTLDVSSILLVWCLCRNSEMKGVHLALNSAPIISTVLSTLINTIFVSEWRDSIETHVFNTLLRVQKDGEILSWRICPINQQLHSVFPDNPLSVKISTFACVFMLMKLQNALLVDSQYQLLSASDFAFRNCIFNILNIHFFRPSILFNITPLFETLSYSNDTETIRQFFSSYIDFLMVETTTQNTDLTGFVIDNLSFLSLIVLKNKPFFQKTMRDSRFFLFLMNLLVSSFAEDKAVFLLIFKMFVFLLNDNEENQVFFRSSFTYENFKTILVQRVGRIDAFVSVCLFSLCTSGAFPLHNNMIHLEHDELIEILKNNMQPGSHVPLVNWDAVHTVFDLFPLTNIDLHEIVIELYLHNIMLSTENRSAACKHELCHKALLMLRRVLPAMGGVIPATPTQSELTLLPTGLLTEEEKLYRMSVQSVRLLFSLVEGLMSFYVSAKEFKLFFSMLQTAHESDSNGNTFSYLRKDYAFLISILRNLFDRSIQPISFFRFGDASVSSASFITMENLTKAMIPSEHMVFSLWFSVDYFRSDSTKPCIFCMGEADAPLEDLFMVHLQKNAIIIQYGSERHSQKYKIELDKWYHMCVMLERKSFSRNCVLSLFLNGAQLGPGKHIQYPSFRHNDVNLVYGSCLVDGRSVLEHSFCGRIASMLMFDSVFSVIQIEQLYALGPNYIHNFDPQTLFTAYQFDSNVNCNSFEFILTDEVRKSLCFAFSALFSTKKANFKPFTGNLDVDLDLFGVTIVQTQDVSQIIFSIGGLALLFPIITQLDLPRERFLIQPEEECKELPESKWTSSLSFAEKEMLNLHSDVVLNAVLNVFLSLLRHSPSAQNTFQLMDGPYIIARVFESSSTVHFNAMICNCLSDFLSMANERLLVQTINAFFLNQRLLRHLPTYELRYQMVNALYTRLLADEKLTTLFFNEINLLPLIRLLRTIFGHENIFLQFDGRDYDAFRCDLTSVKNCRSVIFDILDLCFNLEQCQCTTEFLQAVFGTIIGSKYPYDVHDFLFFIARMLANNRTDFYECLVQIDGVGLIISLLECENEMVRTLGFDIIVFLYQFMCREHPKMANDLKNTDQFVLHISSSFSHYSWSLPAVKHIFFTLQGHVSVYDPDQDFGSLYNMQVPIVLSELLPIYIATLYGTQKSIETLIMEGIHLDEGNEDFEELTFLRRTLLQGAQELCLLIVSSEDAASKLLVNSVHWEPYFFSLLFLPVRLLKYRGYQLTESMMTDEDTYTMFFECDTDPIINTFADPHFEHQYSHCISNKNIERWTQKPKKSEKKPDKFKLLDSTFIHDANVVFEFLLKAFSASLHCIMSDAKSNIAHFRRFMQSVFYYGIKNELNPLFVQRAIISKLLTSARDDAPMLKLQLASPYADNCFALITYADRLITLSEGLEAINTGDNVTLELRQMEAVFRTLETYSLQVDELETENSFFLVRICEEEEPRRENPTHAHPVSYDFDASSLPDIVSHQIPTYVGYTKIIAILLECGVSTTKIRMQLTQLLDDLTLHANHDLSGLGLGSTMKALLPEGNTASIYLFNSFELLLDHTVSYEVFRNVLNDLLEFFMLVKEMALRLGTDFILATLGTMFTLLNHYLKVIGTRYSPSGSLNSSLLKQYGIFIGKTDAFKRIQLIHRMLQKLVFLFYDFLMDYLTVRSTFFSRFSKIPRLELVPDVNAFKEIENPLTVGSDSCIEFDTPTEDRSTTSPVHKEDDSERMLFKRSHLKLQTQLLASPSETEEMDDGLDLVSLLNTASTFKFVGCFINGYYERLETDVLEVFSQKKLNRKKHIFNLVSKDKTEIDVLSSFGEFFFILSPEIFRIYPGYISNLSRKIIRQSQTVVSGVTQAAETFDKCANSIIRSNTALMENDRVFAQELFLRVNSAWRNILSVVLSDRAPWSPVIFRSIPIPSVLKLACHFDIDDSPEFRDLHVSHLGFFDSTSQEELVPLTQKEPEPKLYEIDPHETSNRRRLRLVESSSASNHKGESYDEYRRDVANRRKKTEEDVSDQNNVDSVLTTFNENVVNEEELFELSGDIIFKDTCDLILVSHVTPGTLSLSKTSLRFVSARNLSESEMERSKALSLDSTQITVASDFHVDLEHIRHVYPRNYLAHPTAVELFLETRASYFISFDSKKKRDLFWKRINGMALTKLNVVPLNAMDAFENSAMTEAWQRGDISNFDYIMHLNTLSGRSYNSLGQYPVFPWTIVDFESEDLDLSDPKIFRDLSKPMAALDPSKYAKLDERFPYTHPDPELRYQHGSHYSTPAYVMLFLVRLEPFMTLHVKFQSGHFDHPSRLFHSLSDAFETINMSQADNRELIPEFYYLVDCLLNGNNIFFGDVETPEGEILDISNVHLPPWAKGSPHTFIRTMRAALESEYVSANLHRWIDLIFGHQSRGEAAREAKNLFKPATYAADFKGEWKPSVEELLSFGQTPTLLLDTPHVQRLPLNERTDAFVPNITSIKPIFSFSTDLADGIRFKNDILLSVTRDMWICMHKIEAAAIVNHSNFEEALPLHFQHNYHKVLLALRPNHVCQFIDVNKGRRIFDVCDDAGIIVIGGLWDSSVRLFDYNNGNLIQSLAMHRAPVTAVSFDEKSRFLITGSMDTSCYVWQLHQGMVLSRPLHMLLGHNDGISAVKASFDLDVVISGAIDGSILIHSLFSGRLLRCIDLQVTDPVHEIFTLENYFIVVYKSGLVTLFTYNGHHIISTNVHNLTCTTLFGSYLIACTNNGKCIVLDAFTLEEQVILKKTSQSIVAIHVHNNVESAVMFCSLETGKILVFNIPFCSKFELAKQ
ncbi:hypothetical protein PCE1_003263 [Barthelona sp. PCE]